MVIDPRVERLERHLTRLRMQGAKARLNALLEEGARQELSSLGFLDLVMRKEALTNFGRPHLLIVDELGYLASGAHARSALPDSAAQRGDPGTRLDPVSVPPDAIGKAISGSPSLRPCDLP